MPGESGPDQNENNAGDWNAEPPDLNRTIITTILLKKRISRHHIGANAWMLNEAFLQFKLVPIPHPIHLLEWKLFYRQHILMSSGHMLLERSHRFLTSQFVMLSHRSDRAREHAQ